MKQEKTPKTRTAPKRGRMRTVLLWAAVVLIVSGILLGICLLKFPGVLGPGFGYPDPQPTVSASAIPPYGGQDCIILDGGRPAFTGEDLRAGTHVSFSAFDSLGRTGAGEAILGPETLPTGERSRIGDIRPSGWHNVRYDDLIEDHYLYNRCHVIGYLLCGDNATPENLFTGTRYLNATTMVEYELRVMRYIRSSGKHVAYRVTPTYAGDDLVAFGVQIEAMSVEDPGKGLSLNVFLYNVQPGVLIDYRTGDSRRDPDYVPDHSAVLIPDGTDAGGGYNP